MLFATRKTNQMTCSLDTDEVVCARIVLAEIAPENVERFDELHHGARNDLEYHYELEQRCVVGYDPESETEYWDDPDNERRSVEAYETAKKCACDAADLVEVFQTDLMVPKDNLASGAFEALAARLRDAKRPVLAARVEMLCRDEAGRLYAAVSDSFRQLLYFETPHGSEYASSWGGDGVEGMLAEALFERDAEDASRVWADPAIGLWNGDVEFDDAPYDTFENSRSDVMCGAPVCYVRVKTAAARDFCQRVLGDPGWVETADPKARHRMTLTVTERQYQALSDRAVDVGMNTTEYLNAVLANLADGKRRVIGNGRVVRWQYPSELLLDNNTY